MNHFKTISYLKQGNKKQQEAYRILTKYGVWEKLTDFSPLLAGTIPIAIDIDNSDLDIICCFNDVAVFTATLKKEFSDYKGFTIREAEDIDPNYKTVVCNFIFDDFEIEIFGQNRKSEEQNAYRHMLIEYQILEKEGEQFRQQIIALKKEGYKTEPAFAKLLELRGNPYYALLNYSL
ncbi:DUF4269 domain-containing protein [Flavobacterium suaedae]|nr:DUF4269 domain-containing protein [Flavobacterium suaedae]